jgi:hypothetical protein
MQKTTFANGFGGISRFGLIGIIAAGLGLVGTPALAQSDGKIGVEAIAMVEDISNAPNAKVEAFDTVLKNQLIDLGRKGRMKLSYTISCRVETIRGGRVTVAADPRSGGSKVSGGRLRHNGKNCVNEHRKKMAALAASSKEGAVVVPRVNTPYGTSDWSEKTIAIRRPTFVWQRPDKGRVGIAVLEMDHPSGPKVVWRTRSSKNHLRYPRNRKRFKIGAAYGLQVTYPDGTVKYAGFSYDPHYEALKNTATNAVYLRK